MLNIIIIMQEMLFKKHKPAPECDQAPCGTGMHYLAPSYDRTVSVPVFVSDASDAVEMLVSSAVKSFVT